MPQYRKKPIVIDAFMADYTPGHSHILLQTAPGWFTDAAKKTPGDEGGVYLHRNGLWVVWTLEGLLEISPGDFVIQGIKGEIYPCKPDIFQATYERVSE